MKSKDEYEKIDTKNRACYYFDDIVKDMNINFSHILLDKKLFENISVYDKLELLPNYCVLGSIK